MQPLPTAPGELAAAPDVVDHHDYVWARLPFVVPMAIATARRRADRPSHELARLIRELGPLLLGHLVREERALARDELGGIRDGIHADHVAVTALLAHIRNVAGNDLPRAGADPTELALHLELLRLDEHIQAQISLEEYVMGRQRAGVP